MSHEEHAFLYYRSPEDIRECSFQRRRRGLDEDEVYEFLDLLADQVASEEHELRALQEEVTRLQQENEQLRAELARTPPVAEPEAGAGSAQVAETLRRAEQVAEALLEDAVRRAQETLAMAQAQRRAILRDAS